MYQYNIPPMGMSSYRNKEPALKEYQLDMATLSLPGLSELLYKRCMKRIDPLFKFEYNKVCNLSISIKGV